MNTAHLTHVGQVEIRTTAYPSVTAFSSFPPMRSVPVWCSPPLRLLNGHLMFTWAVSTTRFEIVGSTNSHHRHGLTIPRKMAPLTLVIRTNKPELGRSGPRASTVIGETSPLRSSTASGFAKLPFRCKESCGEGKRQVRWNALGTSLRVQLRTHFPFKLLLFPMNAATLSWRALSAASCA